MELTQEELNKPATKGDLLNLATKDDVKEALANYPTKDEMNARFDAAFEFFASKEDLKSLEKKVDTMGEKIDTLTGTVEGLATLVKQTLEERTSNIAAHDRIQEDIKKIDIRVKKLEGATA